jgi:hypothetical protein
MKTDLNLEPQNESFTAASGPTLLTDDEIAAVGGGVLDRELPYIEGTIGAGLAIGSGAMGGAIATGVVLAGAPILAGVAMAGLVVTAGVGMWMLYDALNGGSLHLS